MRTREKLKALKSDNRRLSRKHLVNLYFFLQSFERYIANCKRTVLSDALANAKRGKKP